MNTNRSGGETAVSRLSVSSTGGTDGGTDAGCGGGGRTGEGGFADEDSSDDISNGGAAATARDGEAEPAMPEEVFKWMTHTVNQDFVRLGYPSILTKSADQEFVSLCPLIRNCSSVLTLLKARRLTSADADSVATASAAADGCCNANSAVAAPMATSALNRRKQRRWGLFTGGKHSRRGAAAAAAAAGGGGGTAARPHQHHQQQEAPTESTGSLHESMARKMRRDTERIIRRTGCLDARALQTAGLREPAPYPEGSLARSDFAFVRSTWRSFRKLARERIAECAEYAKRAEDLQRQLTEASAEVDRLRSALNSSNQQQQLLPSTPTSTSQESAGRLQRVGGFLRRAVSRERLTFGRSSSRLDTATSSGTQQQQPQCHGHPAETRSRASSQPPPLATTATASARVVDSDLQRLRMEFEKRERFLLSEREKLKQANSKLTFRIQYLSGLASAAARQQQNQQQQQHGPGGVDHVARNERRLRRAERRVSELRREASVLRKSLGERTQALGSIAKATAQLQLQIGDLGDKATCGSAAAPAPAASDQPAPQPPPSADEPALLAKFVESTCQSAASHLQRLQRQCTEAEARVAALTECLRPAAVSVAAAVTKTGVQTGSAVATPEPITELNSPSTAQPDLDAVEQTRFDLANRIINQLTAMGLSRQDRDELRQLKDVGKAPGCGDVEKSHRSVFSESFRQQQQQQQQQPQQQRRTRGSSHDPRSQSNSYFY